MCIRDSDIGEDLSTKIEYGSNITGLISLEQGHFRNLADLGFGILQLIPIIIRISAAIIQEENNNSHLLIIEEPGSHLHPKYQSKLADMFCDAISVGATFMIETHSEYFLRKLQWLVADEMNKDIKERKFNNKDILIHNLTVNKKGHKKQIINIKENGHLDSPFYQGFYDEQERLENELEILSKISNAKRKIYNKILDSKQKLSLIHI